MASVESELWHIFTFYSLHGNPLDPEHIRCTQFVKLARDCQMVGSTLSEADPPLLEADIQVAYTAEVKRADRSTAPTSSGGGAFGSGGSGGSGGVALQKMNYNDFLTALMKISIKVYPRSRTVDEAFQRLLMDNVLPLASRRVPDNIDMFLEAEDVQRLFAYYSDALEGIFTFYATSDKRSAAALVASAVKAGHLASGPYAGAHTLTVSGRSPARATRGANTMKEAMGYPEFLKFAADFDLSSSVILSTLEIGDIYLSSLRCPDHDSTIRKLTFPEFWEALVRCALVAYSKISDSSVLDKIRGLFLYMWRAINRSVPRAFVDRRDVSTYAGDLLAGAMLFNKRFTAAWSADGYRDYLSPDALPVETGKAVLNRLLRKGGGGDGLSLSMSGGGEYGGGASSSAGAMGASHGSGHPGGFIGMPVPAGSPSAYGPGAGSAAAGAGPSPSSGAFARLAASGGGGAAGSPSGAGAGSSSSAGAGGAPIYYGSGLVINPATGTAIASSHAAAAAATAAATGGRGGGAAAADYGYPIGGVSEYGY